VLHEHVRVHANRDCLSLSLSRVNGLSLERQSQQANITDWPFVSIVECRGEKEAKGGDTVNAEDLSFGPPEAKGHPRGAQQWAARSE